MKELSFSQKQEIELLISLSSSGEIPFKLAYLGDGAYFWDKISSQRANYEDGIHHMEQELLQKRLSSFLQSFPKKKINLVDLGCGNGTPCLPILREATQLGFDIEYIAMDISEEMLKIAEENIRKEFKKLKIIKKVFDFEGGNFSEITYKLSQNGNPNFFIFLGNTLGNFSDPGRILSNFRDSMGTNDFLLIGTELENLAKVNLIAERYKNEKSVKDFLTNIPKKLGINEKDSDYTVVWNERKQQIEIKLDLKNNILININNEKVFLKKYEQILLARSIKYNEQSITKLIAESGFRNELLTTDRDRSYILTLVQPSRYQF